MHVARMILREKYRVWKGPLGKSRRRQEDNIKGFLEQIGWDARTGLICLRTEYSNGLL